MYISKLKQARKGLSTIASIFMLLLMFAAMTGLLVAFLNYNLSAKEQMDIEHKRAQEKIELTKIEVNDQFEISNVIINNTGSIEVKIRALYEILNGETMLLFDPSDYSDSTIPPSKSLSIEIPEDIPEIPFVEQAKIVAATSRGTKTLDYIPDLVYGPVEPPTNYDPTKLYVGPLMLKFDDFFYHTTLDNGTLDGTGWQPGWIVDEEIGSPRAWKITVMNIDNRNLTITKFSSFNIVSTSSPQIKSWYINTTDNINHEQFLEINQTESIIYIWNGPFSDVPQYIGNPFKDSTCMVFLTFFGFFHETDETKSPYAQTIPFEASITIVG